MLRIRPPQRQLLGDFLFEQMMPENHLLRSIAAVVDFSLINGLLADCYSQRYGRPVKEPDARAGELLRAVGETLGPCPLHLSGLHLPRTLQAR
jgi:hypothetical protein